MSGDRIDELRANLNRDAFEGTGTFAWQDAAETLDIAEALRDALVKIHRATFSVVTDEANAKFLILAREKARAARAKLAVKK